MIRSIILRAGPDLITRLRVGRDEMPYIAEKVLAVTEEVREDADYRMEIECDETLNASSLKIFLNGEAQRFSVSGNVVTFLPEDNDAKGVFYGCLGLVSFTIFHTGDDGSETRWYTDYASVLIRSGNRNRTVNDCLRYIYDNQKDILKTDTLGSGAGYDGMQSRAYEHFGAQIALLEEIQHIYESSYFGFKENARQKLRPVDTVDRVEKLHYLEAKSLVYIATHPENLRRETVGIPYGNARYLPEKTLMTRTVMSPDIYENRVIVSFLYRVVKESGDLERTIIRYLESISTGHVETEGYFSSSEVIFRFARDLLTGFLDRIEKVRKELERLLVGYRTLLPVGIEPFQGRPKPTAILLTIPLYNRVYRMMDRWFGREGYDFATEQMILRYRNAPAIYEAYSLIKIVSALRAQDFRLTEVKAFDYPGRFHAADSSWNEEAEHFANTYEFVRDGRKLTLYYEPMIYADGRALNGISLYRNNTTSLSFDGENESSGRCYTPDYLLKAEDEDGERYVILDAKLSRRNKVRSFEVPKLSYKYLFSVSPLRENVSVKGMGLIYGLTDSFGQTDQPASFFDCEQGPAITPFVRLIPLNETVAEDSTEGEIARIVRTLFPEE